MIQNITMFRTSVTKGKARRLGKQIRKNLISSWFRVARRAVQVKLEPHEE